MEAGLAIVKRATNGRLAQAKTTTNIGNFQGLVIHFPCQFNIAADGLNSLPTCFACLLVIQ